MHKNTPRHLRFANGYTELAMFDEAALELERIAFEDRFAVPILEVRLNLCIAAKQWYTAAGVGRELARLAPGNENAWVHFAYALRELGRIEEAREALLLAEPLHGAKSAILHYNLACYFCLLGDLPTARDRLAQACKMEKKLKADALEDPDLAALWADVS